MRSRNVIATLAALWIAHAVPCNGQQSAASPPPADTRTQYPSLLEHGYFGLSVGAINTPLSTDQLQPGFRAASVQTPHAAFEVTLFGREFGRYFAAETTYIRPMQWASFQNVNGTGEDHTVWVVNGTFKLRGRLPITDQVTLYGDAGVAATSRHGAKMIDGSIAVEDAHYPAVLIGGGVEYSMNPRWSVVAGMTRTAASRTHNQPASLLFSGGIRYHLAPLPADRVEQARRAAHVIPRQTIEVGYAASLAGFGANHFFSHTVPIFWQGNLSVDHGFAVRYQRNIFHTERLFAFDVGVSAARWHAPKSEEHLASVSVYPLLRFILVRSDAADVELYYSLSGPSVLSRSDLNGVDVGSNRFTFQDLIGVRVFAGTDRKVAVGVGLGHYSNGNLFPINAGVAIPLTMTVGYAF